MKNRSPRLLQGRNSRALLFDAERPSNSLPLPPSARGAHTSDGQSAGGGQAFFWNRFALCASVAGTRLAASQDGSEARLGCCVFGVLLLCCTFLAHTVTHLMNYDDPLRFSTAASKRTIVQPLTH